MASQTGDNRRRSSWTGSFKSTDSHVRHGQLFTSLTCSRSILRSVPSEKIYQKRGSQGKDHISRYYHRIKSMERRSIYSVRQCGHPNLGVSLGGVNQSNAATATAC
ncbi:hypothetical protein RvY_14778 [Ramazzottius varieornatus]|uniref:Uncharacterized protein n=1 Tax=Ramazzottius varieornatus TaxID=947166 RepID=A0A1D1W0U0_RAMVA|nr:hypothetical protein RvY_14778 [Ramazzottius varieornatus]